ncbi:MAG: Cobalamin synthase [Syntrophorhabdus sp. PtaU1.Bin058]|nr:MAG: Cobalamin synthase [Syntrophorhabdus sp. PtaU1.Bin058]
MTLKNILLAFQFLTIIPIKTTGEVSDKDIADSSIFFPLVGVFQGLLLSALSFISLRFFSEGITAAFIIFIYLLTNGGFHLDGLSDTFDALSVKSTGNREKDIDKRLAVMKDSTVGPIGVAAICLMILMKYLLIREILVSSPGIGKYLLIFLMPVFSKWAVIPAAYHGKNVRTDGLGRIFLENLNIRHLLLSTAFMLVACLAAFFIYQRPALFAPPSVSFGFFVFLLYEMLVIYLFCLFFITVLKGRFGGLTGDNLGAVHEISELVFLIAALLWR